MSEWTRKRPRQKQETAAEWRKKRKGSAKRKRWPVWDSVYAGQHRNHCADPIKKARRLEVQASRRANR